ncbi:MAG: cation:proton antiporter [Acidobacteriaceae bacterium]
MNLTLFLGVLGGLLVLAFLANLLARKTGIPDVLVLMGTGVLLGPGLHLMDLTQYPGLREGFGTLALILILLEAGLELEIRQLLRSFPAGIMLAMVSYALCLGLVVPAAHQLLGLSWKSALIVAAVLGGVSASVSLPVLQTMQIRPKLRMILTVEGAMADILSVLTVTALLNAPAGSVPLGMLAGSFAVKLSISLALGIAAGVGWAFLLPRLSDRRFWQVLTFGAVLVLFAVTEVAGGGDLLAVLIFGLALSNLPVAQRYLGTEIGTVEGREKAAEGQAGLLAFHAELSFLVRTFFFVLVGMEIRFEGFVTQWLPIVVIFAAILVARWLSVVASRLLWRDSHPMERELAFWMHPRGLITVVLALRVVNARGSSWSFLVDLAFGILLLSGAGMTVGTIRGRRMGELAELHEADGEAVS